MTFTFKQNTRNDFDDEIGVRERHWHPRAGDVVIDVGAGIGSYTLPALAAGASVVAFSPDEASTRDLVENIRLNDSYADRCVVTRKGLYDRAGWLHPNPDKTRYVFSVEEPAEEDAFPVHTLDGVNLGRVDWIKIDVEGAELEVLRGAEATIRRHRPRLLVECHLFMDNTLGVCVADWVLALGLGYKGEAHNWHGVVHIFFEVPA